MELCQLLGICSSPNQNDSKFEKKPKLRRKECTSGTLMNLKYGKECYRQDSKLPIVIIEKLGLICSQKDLGLGGWENGIRKAEKYCNDHLRIE